MGYMVHRRNMKSPLYFHGTILGSHRTPEGPGHRPKLVNPLTVLPASCDRHRSTLTTVLFPDMSYEVANYEEVVAEGSTVHQIEQTNMATPLPSALGHDYIYEETYSQTMDHCYDVSVQLNQDKIDCGTQTDIGSDYFIAKVEQDSSLTNLFVQQVMKNDKTVRAYTGVDSVHMILGLFNILLPYAGKLKYWSGRDSKNKKKYEENKTRRKPGPQRKMPLFHEFLMTMLRLRLNLTTFVLADLFGISDTRVSQVFITWVSFMDMIFSPLLKWPKLSNIRKHMPSSFKKNFSSTRAIIDCSEFYIQRPRQPTPQSATFSSYKSHNTFKVLFAITPSGAFSFVSDLWGGNTSDRFIVQNSGFLDLIQQGDDIMADRGFNIRDLLLEKHATLTIPSFTRKCDYGSGKRLNVNEIKSSKNISKFRIHVERAIGRLKDWKITSQVMPLSLKPLANKIVCIVAFFCNTKKALLDK